MNPVGLHPSNNSRGHNKLETVHFMWCELTILFPKGLKPEDVKNKQVFLYCKVLAPIDLSPYDTVKTLADSGVKVPESGHPLKVESRRIDSSIRSNLVILYVGQSSPLCSGIF